MFMSSAETLLYSFFVSMSLSPLSCIHCCSSFLSCMREEWRDSKRKYVINCMFCFCVGRECFCFFPCCGSQGDSSTPHLYLEYDQVFLHSGRRKLFPYFIKHPFQVRFWVMRAGVTSLSMDHDVLRRNTYFSGGDIVEGLKGLFTLHITDPVLFLEAHSPLSAIGSNSQAQNWENLWELPDMFPKSQPFLLPNNQWHVREQSL